MSIRSLIIDDEPLARRVIEKYLQSLPAFHIAGHCSNAIEAINFLHTHEVDLIFLDIKMPELSGLDFLRTLSNPPKVIITTAYSEFALEGYEYDVMDYLLKPIPFDRFLKAVNKHPLLQAISKQNPMPKESSQHILIETDGRKVRMAIEDIHILEGYGNYIKVWSRLGMLLTSGPMKEMENRLPSGSFIRIHKSFIVQVNAIESLEGNMLKIRNKTLPVGRAYKLKLEEILHS